MSEKDIKEFEIKLKDLEKSIQEFQNKHIEQVNSLIDLFSDILEIIKDKDSVEKKSIEEQILPEITEVKIVSNDLTGKSPKEIVDYIMSISVNKNEDEFKDLDIKIKADNIEKETLKIEKSFSPVEEWIEAFKKTDKYINVKNEFNALNEMELK